MLQIFTKQDEGFEKAYNKASKKFNLNPEDIDFVVFDNFLFSNVFFMAGSKKKIYLRSTENKKPEIFEAREIEKLYVEKKTDLNLAIKGGRVINLTSVVSVKSKVAKLVNRIAETLKNYR